MSPRGDANAEPDPLKVEYAGVLGTVAAHIPFIGIYAGALNTLPGKLYAFGFIVAAAMLYLLAHISTKPHPAQRPGCGFCVKT